MGSEGVCHRIQASAVITAVQVVVSTMATEGQDATFRPHNLSVDLSHFPCSACQGVVVRQLTFSVHALPQVIALLPEDLVDSEKTIQRQTSRTTAVSSTRPNHVLAKHD